VIFKRNDGELIEYMLHSVCNLNAKLVSNYMVQYYFYARYLV